MEYHVFLSYSHKDRSFMECISTALRSEGLTVWTDAELEKGEDSTRAIEAAIKNAGCIVAICSPDAAQSDLVREELDFAEKIHKKRIFPVLAHGAEVESIVTGYALSPYTDIRDEARFQDEIQDLIRDIGNHLLLESESQQEASQASGNIQSDISRSQLEPAPNFQLSQPLSRPMRISPWNPIEQVFLVWWLFIKPEKLSAYTQNEDTIAAKNAHAWIVGNLTLLPILIVVSAIVVGFLPPMNTLFHLSPIALGTFAVFSWIFTGSLNISGNKTAEGATFGIVIGGIVGAIICSLASGINDGINRGDIVITILLVITNIMPFVTAFILENKNVSVFSYSFLISNNLVFITGNIFIALTTYSTSFVLEGAFSCVIELLALILVVARLRKNIHKQGSSLLSKLILVTLLFFYGVLIWFSWVGGWHSFGA